MTNTNFEEQAAGAPDRGASEPRKRFTKQAERLLREVPIGAVIGEYTPLRRTKRGFTGNCSRHDEPRRTLRIDPRANTFSCFFCGIRGDAITFLEAVEDFTYGQALEALEKIKYSNDGRDAA